MIDAERSDEAVVRDVKRRRHSGGDEPRRRLEQLELDAVRIGPHAEAAGAADAGKPRGLELLRHAGAVVHLCQRAVVANRRGPPVACANRDVAHLPIRRQFTEQDEIAQRIADGLLMDSRLEDAVVELRGRRRIGHDDVQMFEAQILERQRGRRLGPGRRRAMDAGGCAHRREKRSS